MLRLFVGLMLIGSIAYADNTASIGLSLPTLPQNYQSDRFRTGDLDCQNAIGSATNMEFGVTGVIDEPDWTGATQGGNVGVYGRIVIPLGKRPKSRVDCNRLYELELRKKQLEVLKLEQELNRLRELEFEN